jgi:hypothetical protein
MSGAKGSTQSAYGGKKPVRDASRSAGRRFDATCRRVAKIIVYKLGSKTPLYAMAHSRICDPNIQDIQLNHTFSAGLADR